MDGDDEVRDRATYYLQILGSNNNQLKKDYIVENDLVSLALLEKALKDHLNGPLDTPFDVTVVPKSVPVQEETHNDAMIVTSTYYQALFFYYNSMYKLKISSRYKQSITNYQRRS